MLTWLRRCCVLLVLMFWVGGGLFYAAVVIPLGRARLPEEFSKVTTEATNVLNWAGVVAVLVLSWDVIFARERTVWLIAVRWASFGVAGAALPLLFWLHGSLDALVATGEGT